MPSVEEVIDALKARKDLKLGPNRYFRPECSALPFQVLGAVLLFHCKNFLLADACGLGKTLQVLLSYAMRKEACAQREKPCPRMIVATEKSGVLQWADEVEKFFQGITVEPVRAAKKAKGFERPQDYRKHLYETSKADIFVMSQKTFTQDWRRNLLRGLAEQSIVVLDEADLIRKTTTQVFQAFSQAARVSQGFKALTATPIYRSLEDYYNLMTVVGPKVFGDRDAFLKSFCVTEFRKIYVRGQERWIMEIKDFKNVEEFHHRARYHLILRTPEDVGAELPEVVEKPIYLEMDPDQQKLYEKASEGEFNVLPGAEEPRRKEDKTLETEEEVEGRLERTRESGLVKMIRKIQVTGDPSIVSKEKTTSVKMEKLLQLLQGDFLDQHVVVYSQSSAVIRRIEETLRESGIESCKITGDIASETARDKVKKLFQAPGPPYVLLVTSAAKKCLNLQVAGAFIFFDQPLVWGDAQQLIGRVRRIGSKWKHVVIVRLMVRGTVDETVYNILSQEDSLVEKCLKVNSTMSVSPELLDHISQKMQEGMSIREAMESWCQK